MYKINIKYKAITVINKTEYDATQKITRCYGLGLKNNHVFSISIFVPQEWII